MTYLHVTETSHNDVIVAASDEQSLAVIRDEVSLHGYRVGPVQHTPDGFRFAARSDEPGKVREFLMGLDDVQVTA
jgi:hypothetical protein